MEYAFLGLATLMILALTVLWTIDRRGRRTHRTLVALMAHLGADGGEPREPSDAVKALAADPRGKIAAIKAYRAEAGLGLVEAKEAIERLATLHSSGGGQP